MSLNLAVKHPTNFKFSANILNENRLVWAVFCSILLHVSLIFVMPNLKVDEVKKPDILVVQLVKKPEPLPVALPEPVQARPEPVKPKVEPEPRIKPLPTPTVIKNEPAPVQPPPAVAAPQTEVIAVTPKADAPPSPVPPVPIVVPEPPPPVAPSQTDIDDARDRYGNALWNAIGRHKQYPRIAQMRGWEGEVVVEVQLDGNGKMISKKVIQSSGHETLDKQALVMVDKAAPFPTPPEALRGSSFSIKVPIPFRLERE